MPDVLFTSKDFDGVQAEMKTLIDRALDENKINLLRKWREGIQTNIVDFKEEQLQADFLNDIFGTVLGYNFDYQGSSDWNLQKEEKTQQDATKVDGVLGYFSNKEKDVRAVIELKHLTYSDLDREQNRKERQSPVDQAFAYASKMGEKCRWVLVSNFNEIRLYRYPDKSKCEIFFITELLETNNDKSFKHLPKFLYLLHFGYLFQNLEDEQEESSLGKTERLYRGRIRRLKDITDKFYFRYRKFRRDIFENLRLKNAQIAPLTLFSYTQTILDRLIFMRFAGEVGLTERNELKITKDAISMLSTYQEDKYWSSVKNLFKVFDIGYIRHAVPLFNGELFKENHEFYQLRIDDNLVAELIDFLDSYDFKNDLRVEILGHIFEQSISDIEREKSSISNGELQINADENGKRKQDGVFYTPQYITAYIISETIGKWLHEKEQTLLQSLQIEDISEPEIDFEKWKVQQPELTLKEVVDIHITFWQSYQDALKSVTILDPACGSGAFLTEAFDYLLGQNLKVAKTLFDLRSKQWQQYDIKIDTLAKPQKEAKKQKKQGKGLLISSEPVAVSPRELAQFRKNIVLHNLYGVDLNPESVGITKLSLYLKTADRNEPLADLRGRIKQGNSLITDREVTAFAFDWEKEFPTVFSGGGFDIVVGNPPYVSFQNNLIAKKFILYFNEKYQTCYKIFDLFGLFIEKFIGMLKKNGFLGFICPSVLLMNESFSKLRTYIYQNGEFSNIAFLADGVFKDAVVPTITFAFHKNKLYKDVVISGIEEDKKILPQNNISHSIFYFNPEKGFNINFSEKDITIFQKMSKDAYFLGDVLEIRESIKTGDDKRFISDVGIDENYYPLVTGKDVNRYSISQKRYILFDEKALQRPTKLSYYQKEKLFIRRVGATLTATYDNQGYLSTHVLYIAYLKENSKFDIKFLLALINSKLFDYAYAVKFPAKGSVFPEIRIGNLRELYVKDIDIFLQQPFISLVNQVLTLKAQNQDTSLLEQEIDAKVYEIYGLSEEETKMIENK